MTDSEIGISAGRGSSPGATGRLFPDATLPLRGGGTLSLDSFRPRNDLVIVMLGGGAIVSPVRRLLDQLDAARREVSAEDGQIVAIAAADPREWREAWPYGIPLAFDAHGALHRRVAATDEAGAPAAAVYVTDRYREIYAVLRPAQARWPANAREVIEWLTFANIQCPECNAPGM